ncbi:amidohydrolase family protein [Pseudodesulfovibrio sp. JC047]|uniref:amidohydrolase n=1 Tax=Pseudodesulfovibrio sp. JC047 TaxID=2683199 RepID=UPI0013CFB7E2|nr:amidohydrolase [Pseudodesulfovibrio sp. JC047]NDV19274.1 amidohydrolase family protein [Pseudodesulfovibrio sp. JC047]
MKKIWGILFLLLALVCATGAQASQTTVFTGGTVYTVDQKQPWAEAVVVTDNKIAFVGSAHDAKQYINEDTTVIDVSGKTIFPGFVSTHDHLIASGWTTLGVQIYDAKDRADALAKIKSYADANPDKKVIQGIGWDQSMLGGLPTARDLDAVVPNRPAIILDNTIHDAWLNTAALKAANISKDSKDTVPGVTYWVRDDAGNPTGVAIEIQWFQAYIDMGAWDPETMIAESAQMLQAIAASNGTTTFLAPGIVTPNIKDVHGGMETDFVVAMDMMQDWADTGKLKMRTLAQPMFKSTTGDPQRFVDFGIKMQKRYNSDMVKVSSLKIHPEGNTIAGTAPFIEPYKDSENRGSFNVEPEVTKAIVTKAAKVDLDVFIHTDGDRSSRAAVDAILAARKINSDNRSALHHAIWVHPDDQKRIIDNKIPVNSTPNFTNTFGGGATANMQLIGEERVNSSLGRYPHFARHGVKVSISADVPSTPPSMQAPLYVVTGATTLLDISDPKSTPFPPNRTPMTVEQAIRAITIDAAWQLRMEDMIGSLEVGKYADLVVLDGNPFEVEPIKIAEIDVLMTMMNGTFTYKKGDETTSVTLPDARAMTAMAEFAHMVFCGNGLPVGHDHSNHTH